MQRFVFIALTFMLVSVGCGGGAPTAVADAGDDLAPDLSAPLDGAPADDATSVGPDAVGLDASPADDRGADDVPVEPLAPDAAPIPDAPFRRTGDAQCAGHPDSPACDTASGRCVPCTPTSDRCPAGYYCAPGMNRCAVGCRDDAGCAAAGGGALRCDPVGHTCVVCARDEHCAPGALCVGATCVPGCSATRACPAGQGCCGGACVDTETNIANCGACGRACTAPNATPACRGGVCAVGSCTAPFGNCDGNDANGCEADLSTTVSACGACGTTCATRPNATARCEMGACRYTCAAGFGDCDGNAANGCEANLATTPDHCGMCGRACSLRNATAACNLGACTVAACDVGFGDCNTNPLDGCEADLRTSLSHCGGCGRGCSLPHGYPTCTSGLCRLIGCDPGYGDCDRTAATGCEVMLSSLSNCGICGGACPAPTGLHVVSRCVPDGSSYDCGFACESGWTDCDRNLANGCEAMGACTVERELFYDGFESGIGRWSTDPVWRWGVAGFYAPCAGTREMIAERSIFGACVQAGDATLITPIDISGATSITLTHQSRSGLGPRDRFGVEASGDGGRTWTPVASQGAATCGVRAVTLDAFVGSPTLLLRFTFYDECGEETLWRLDEVRVRALIRNY